jgi:hypothetical protein
MPGKREEQLALARKWLEALPERGTEWEVSPTEIAELGVLTANAEEAMRRAEAGDGNRTLNAQAREAFNALVGFMRIMRRRRFTTPPLIDSDWVSLGMRPPDTIRTPHVTVDEEVDFVIGLRGIRELEVDFWISGSSHKAKPQGYDGAVIVWGERALPPEHPEDFVHHAMASRTPHLLQFDESERGKTVWVALAWQNERGILGRWSEYKSAVVP